MNKLLLTLSVFFCVAGYMAQSELYTALKKNIETFHPEISTANRLIAFNAWSLDDQESRDANKSFEKAYDVYKYARLKGGLKGLIVVVVSKENLTGNAVITLHKDGVVKCISVKAEDIPEISAAANKNMVFDSNGNEVYANLPATAIYSKIQQLITR